MATIIGGYDTGLLDSSLFLLNRDDQTQLGSSNGDEDIFVNVSNGNLVIRHTDGYLPSQGEDFSVIRTYNSRGTLDENLAEGWNISTPMTLEQITANEIRISNWDSSQFRFYYDSATDTFTSVDGAGSYETIVKGDFDYHRMSMKNNGDMVWNTETVTGYTLTRADQSILYFDVNGSLIQSVDTNGNIIQYEYQSNRLTRVLDDTGHVISYTYEGSNLTQISDENGNVLVTYEYNQNGLHRVIDREGHITEYTYFMDGSLSSIRFPTDVNTDERIVRFEYQASKKDMTSKTPLLSSIIDAQGNETRFSYDLASGNWSQYAGGTTWVTNALGIERAESNDSVSVQWRIENGYYAQWDQKSYDDGLFLDANGNYVFDQARWDSYVHQVDEILHNHAVSYSYDENGAITQVTNAKTIDGVVVYDYQTQYVYDDQENLIAIVDANGYAITHSDDPYWRDQRKQLGFIDAAGEGKQVANLTTEDIEQLNAFFTTQLHYDEHGNLIRREDNQDNVTEFTYTDFNKLATETHAMGYALTQSNEELYQEKRSELGYSALVEQLSDADKQALLALHTIYYSYDQNQNLIEILAQGSDITRFEYDEFGNVTRQIRFLDATDLVDPSKQQVTQYFYDAYGNNIKTIEANAWLLIQSDDEYWRDLRAELGVVDGNNNGKWRAQITPLEEAYLISHFTSYNSYDLFGNRLTHTDGNGGVTHFTYDNDNRLTSVTNPEGHATFYQYDAVGNRIGVTDVNGHTVVYVYNKNNQLISVIDPSENDPAQDRTTNYKYDVVGNRTAVTDAEGNTTNYVFREDNRLLEILTPMVSHDGTTVSYQTSYEYDAIGNRIAVNDNNGYVTEYVYNNAGLLVQQTDPEGNITQYRYDANFNQVQVIIGVQLPEQQRRILSYVYDEEDQLVAQLDALGNRKTIEHDAVGNIIRVVDENGQERRFAYDHQNRFITEYRAPTTDPVTGLTVEHSVNHYFDGENNQIATRDENGQLTRFTFDKNNRVVMISDANDIETVFEYDGRNNRTAVHIGVQAHVDETTGSIVFDDVSQSSTTRYTYDEFNQVVSKVDGVGNALTSSDSPLYVTMRQALGYIDSSTGQGKLVAQLSDLEKAQLKALYTERYAYDRTGNLIETSNHLGHVATKEYDALHRLIAEVNENGEKIRLSYDGNNNLIKTTDAVGDKLISSDEFYYQDIRAAHGYSKYASALSDADKAALLALYSTQFEYDGNNRISNVIDPLGVVTQRVFDNVGNLVSETVSAGTLEAQTTTYQYDLNNRLIQQTDAEGNPVYFEYDAVGNRTRSVDARGFATQYIYDQENRVIQIIDPSNHTTTYQYDGVGNRLSIIDARGGLTSMAFDPTNRMISSTDAQGRITQFEYDARSNLITQTTAFGTTDQQTTQFEYDAENNLRAVIDAHGNKTVNDYDRVYNQISVTDANGHQTQYAFDAVNRVIEVIDALGGKTTYQYDANGNQISITDANGYAIISSNDAYYQTLRQSMGYTDSTGAGLLVDQLTVEQKDALLNAYTSSFNYDNRNQVIKRVSASGVVSTYTYDAHLNQTDIVVGAGTSAAQQTSFVFDKNNRLVTTTNAFGNALISKDTAYYRILRVELGYAALTSDLTDAQKAAIAEQYSTHQTYDENGNVIQVTDSLDRVTSYEYDENNQVIRIIEPMGHALATSNADYIQVMRVNMGFAADSQQLSSEQQLQLQLYYATSFNYDEVGNRSQIIDAQGNITTQYFNSNNELSVSVDSLGFATAYFYDNNGNLIKEVRYQQAIDNTFDPAQQPVLIESTGDQVIRYGYDVTNRLVRSIDANGYVTDHLYDNTQNIIATVHHADAVVVDSAVSINAQVVSASAHDRTTSFVYDSKDQLVEKLDAEGYLTHYQYDALGNRTTLVRFEDASDLVDLTKQQVMRYQYDDMNRMTHVTNAAGITAESIYDQFGNKIRVTHGANTEASRTTYFAYDDMNRQIETRNAAGIITRFEYDSENQRRLVYEAWDQPEQRISQTVYDENGQVRQLIFADGTSKHFQYDAAGNRTVIIDANGHETRYVYDSKNQLSQIVAADGSVTRYEYDAYGNAVQVIDALGQTTTQYFNKLNQLSVLVNADGSVVKYEYDAFGNRISETRFANRLAAEVDPNTLPTVIASENDQTRFFVFDHTGNLVRSVDSLGHVVEYQYDEMGNQTQIHAYANSVNVTDYAQARDLELTPSALDHLQQFEYDNVGKLSLTTDAEGYSTRYQYDVFGNTTLIESGLYLLDSNDPNYDSSKINLAHPTQVQYSYDELNRLVSMQDSLNVVTNYQYDKLGNRIAIIEGANTDQSRQWSFSYDEMNRMVSKTDPAGIVTQFEYDLAGQQTAIIEAYGLPSQRVTQFSYDELGRLIQQTHADQTITQFQYNGTGQLVQKTDAVGTADQRLTTFNYDAMNRMIEETIAAGSTDALTTIHQYDSFGNRVLTTIAPNTVDALTTTQVFDNRNQMIAQTNGIGATTIYSYDAFGNLIQQSITDRNSGITQATQMQYDGRNLLVSTSDANNVTTLMRYDAAGNLIDQTVAANTSDAVVTAFSYDQANRLVEKVIDPDGLALSTQLAYDVYGNLVSETRGGVTRNTEYDVMNHALVVTDGEGFSTSFAYDVFGNQTSITLGQYLVSPGDANYDANKALLAHETTTRFAYDAMNRQTFMVDSLGVVTKYDYDARGNKIEDTQAYAYLAPTDSVIEANMVRISSVQTEVLFTDARTFRYEYNLRDQIVNTIQPNGTVAHTDYNDAGLQCQKILDHGEGKLNVTTQYFYDASGQVQFIVDPMGHVTHFEYDDFGNLIAETKGLALDGNNQPSTALTTDARTTRYSYDLANRKTAEIIDPNGLAITTQYEYDQRGNSIAIVDANGNRGESAYDKADRLIWQRNGEGDIKTFDYDARSNRIAEHFFAIDGSSLLRGELPTIDAKDKTVRYQFDNNDRLISRTDARGIINTLQYDAVGNLVLNIENANNWNGEAARVRKNEYNHANVVVTQYEHMGLDQAGEPVFIDGVTVKTDYEYDAVYNLIEKNVLNTWYNTLVEPATRVEQVQTTQFKYDLNNRITERAIDPNGLNIRTGYRYDALGNTVAEISANGFAVSGHLTGSARDSLLAQYTTYTFYDAASRAIYQVEPHGFVQESQYDAVGNQVKTIQYAHAINVLSIADGNLPNVTPNAEHDRTVVMSYDKANRMISSQLDAVENFVLDGQGGYTAEIISPTATNIYDKVGNKIVEIDPNGNKTYFYYDANGQITARLDAEGYFVRMEYDAFGNMTREDIFLEKQSITESEALTLNTDTFVPVGDSRTTEHVYDLGNNAIKTVLPSSSLFVDGQEITARGEVDRTFDAFGNILTETNIHLAEENSPYYTVRAYDVAGRLTLEVLPSAVELLQTDDEYAIEHRKQLGIVNADGSGKQLSQLSDADHAQIQTIFSTHYQYDAAGNLREKDQGGRLTTFEYDLNNRMTHMHMPHYTKVDVDVNGNVITTENYRIVASMSYDANDNIVSETRVDGTRLRHQYDRANRKTASIEENGTYTEYGYSLSGEALFSHTYWNTTSFQFPQKPQVNATHDQRTEYVRDRIGRIVEERQLGDLADVHDDRVSTTAFDANGNKVEMTDARGYQTTFFYNGLNQVVGTVNPNGGVSATTYDARGQVLATQTGGWNAPTFDNNQINHTLATSDGALIEWSTDHATDSAVYVRKAGSSDAWVRYGVEGQYSRTHSIALKGLSADTQYEYYVQSSDAFGYTITTDTQTFRTLTDIQAIAVRDLTQLADGSYQLVVDFVPPVGALNVSLLTGQTGSDSQTLIAAQTQSVQAQGDGSYTAHVNVSSLDGIGFQIQWTDSQGQVFNTNVESLQQQQVLDIFNGTVSTQAGSTSGVYDINTTWNLDLAQVDTYIQSYTDELGNPYTQTHHKVYVAYLPAGSTDEPSFQRADYNELSGKFELNYLDIPEGAYDVYFQYFNKDGDIVEYDSVRLLSLANVDESYQRLKLNFPYAESESTTLQFSYRSVGSSEWADLDVANISGDVINLSMLAEGDYEYQAVLSENGQVLRNAQGSFRLTELANMGSLVDATAPDQAVLHSVLDNQFSIDSLLPLNAGESLSLAITDSDGQTTHYPFDAATFDLDQLAVGHYQLHIVKTLTEQIETVHTDENGVEYTEVQTVVSTLNDISGSITVSALQLHSAEESQLTGLRYATTYQVNEQSTVPVNFTTTGDASSTDYVYHYYDQNGNRIFSNEKGGVWTRYFYDESGNLTKEVRFKYQDPSTGNFVDQVVNLSVRPSLEQLQQNYAAAVDAASQGLDTIRVTTMEYDATNQKRAEETHSQTHGTVRDEWYYDAFNNVILEIAQKGVVGVEQRTAHVFDGMNQQTMVNHGELQFFDTAGNSFSAEVTLHMTYDEQGNQSTKTDAGGYTTKFYHNDLGRLEKEWDAKGSLETKYFYDSLGRISNKHYKDLDTGALRINQYQYDSFDQVTMYVDAMNGVTKMEYDKGGNLVSKLDAVGYKKWIEASADDKDQVLADYTEHFEYDADNRVIKRIDRLDKEWLTAYDAYGTKVSETDGNGRVTSYEIGAYGQILSMTIRMDEAHGNMQGDRLYQEFNEYDWLGQKITITDTRGKYDRYVYNDADQVASLTRVARDSSSVDADQTVDYIYDAAGRVIEETLTRDSIQLHHQQNTYNRHGWLTGVNSDMNYEGGVTTSYDQVGVVYRYDQNGNRVAIQKYINGMLEQENRYGYDQNGRFITIESGDGAGYVFQYDAFGNRISENKNGNTITYQYDHNGRVISSSANEQWQYDANGNVTYKRNASGTGTSNAYDRLNRNTYTNSSGQKTYTYFDGAGNAYKTRTIADDSKFSEVTRFDVLYKTLSKTIEDSWAEDTDGLTGKTHYAYDLNSQLHRIYGSSGGMRYFAYNNEGKILNRHNDYSGSNEVLQDIGYMLTANVDPDGTYSFETESLRQQFGLEVFGRSGLAGAWDKLASYLYVDGNQVADSERSLRLDRRTITADENYRVFNNDFVRSYSFNDWDIVLHEDGNLDKEATALNVINMVYYEYSGYTEYQKAMALNYVVSLLPDTIVEGDEFVLENHFMLDYGDIAYDDQGSVDLTATATNIARRIYGGIRGYYDLTEKAQASIIEYVKNQLPQQLEAGSALKLDNYILILDELSSSEASKADYTYQKISASGSQPGISAQTHTVNTGETLQAVSSAYFGSPSYWYLIAEANNLQGTEELKAGTTLLIPNVAANSINNKESYKMYSESEIIGSESPYIQVKQKKLEWWQKLVMVLVVIIVVAATIATAGAAAAVAGAAWAAAGGLAAAGVLGTVAAVGLLLVTAVAIAAGGYAIGYATSALTQGIEKAAGLREDYDRDAMKDMGQSFAITALAGALGTWATAAETSYLVKGITKATIEVGRQYAKGRDDKEGFNLSYSNIVMAALPDTLSMFSSEKLGWAKTLVNEHKSAVTKGLEMIEKAVRPGDENKVNLIDWIELAGATVEGLDGVGDISSPDVHQQLKAIARESIFIAAGSMVAEHYQEGAGFNYFSNKMGSVIGESAMVQGAIKATADRLGVTKAAKWLGGNFVSGVQALVDMAKGPEPAMAGMAAGLASAVVKPGTGIPEWKLKGYSDGKVAGNQGALLPNQSDTPKTDWGDSTEATLWMASLIGNQPEEGTFGEGHIYEGVQYQEIDSDQPVGENVTEQAKAVAAGPAPIESKNGGYEIKKGDTLSKIAKAHGVSVQELVTLNGIEDANKIYVGKTLQVPSVSKESKAYPSEEPNIAKGTGKVVQAPTHSVKGNAKIIVSKIVQQKAMTFKADLEFAEKRSGTGMKTIATLVTAETSNWDTHARPYNSRGEKLSEALGLGQFLPGTWKNIAEKQGTYLNEKAKELGLVNEKNQIVEGKEDTLLRLRTVPRIALTSIGEHSASNLEKMIDRDLISKSASEKDKSKMIYLAHHEGLEGATVFLTGKSPYPSVKLDQTRATKLLEGNVGKRKASILLNKSENNAPEAYRMWLNSYIDKKIDPSIFNFLEKGNK